MKLVEDHIGDVTGLILDLCLIVGILELYQALHFHVEPLDLEVNMAIEVRDRALLHKLNDIDVVLNARFQIDDFIFQLLLLNLCNI